MPTAHALLVGIARYQRLTPLPAVVRQDARDLQATLTNLPVGAYPPQQVALLQDGEATRANLRAALARLATRAQPEDTVFLYFSCHGARLATGPEAGEYLLPYDVENDAPQAIARSALSNAEMTAALHAIAAQKMVVVFDCCHAAGVGTLKTEAPASAFAWQSGLSNAYYASLVTGRGRVILAAARETEAALVLPAAPNSLFTQHLLAGLRGAAADSKGLVKIFQLFEYLQPRVVQDSGSRQHPVFEAQRLEESFALAHYPPPPTLPAVLADGHEYHAYISYAPTDDAWVWHTLRPRLLQAGLKVAVSEDVEEPGVYRVIGAENAVTRARRVLLVLSEAGLVDRFSEFEGVLTQTLGLEKGQYRLVPLKAAPYAAEKEPLHLRALTKLDFTLPERFERNLERLIRTLQAPL